MEVLRNKEVSEKNAIKESYDSESAKIAANNALEQLMKQAGCKEGEVYGVDCAIMESASGFIRPVSYGMVTCEYGEYPKHTGIDIGQSGQIGGPIYAAAPGQVIAAGNGIVWGSGNMVMIVHNINGRQIITSYAHMNSINVSQGQYVDTSTQIGTIGNTGNSFGPHLHFEISLGRYGWETQGDTFVNPRQYVNFPQKRVYFNTR